MQIDFYLQVLCVIKLVEDYATWLWKQDQFQDYQDDDHQPNPSAPIRQTSQPIVELPCGKEQAQPMTITFPAHGTILYQALENSHYNSQPASQA